MRKTAAAAPLTIVTSTFLPAFTRCRLSVRKIPRQPDQRDTLRSAEVTTVDSQSEETPQEQQRAAVLGMLLTAEATHADSRGSTASTQATMMRAGTTTSKTPGGRASSALAPAIDPVPRRCRARTH
jgi:hypothetical protein